MENENIGTKAEELKIQNLPGLQGDSRADLGNLGRLHLKTQSVTKGWEIAKQYYIYLACVWSWI